MKTTKEKVSYCIGLQTGSTLRQQFGDIDITHLTEGFSDSISGGASKLPQEEVKQILAALKQQIETQQRHFFTKVAEENKTQGEAFLQQNKEKEGVVTLNNGLQYKVLKEGPSSGLSPTTLDVVKVHYRGSFIDGRVFDSSYQRGAPLVIPVNRMIAGWSEALQKMRVGDQWQLFIPSYLAYGEAGLGREIGPNVVLNFELELLGINEE